jgi:hypothetical protein
MEKECVPYELALRMKQLGFNKPCFGYWYTEQEILKKIDIQLATIDFLEGEEDYILALTWQQAFRWFREKNDLYYTIEGSKKYGFAFFIYYENDDNGELKSKEYFTYEEAELACLEKLIEIVENNK